MRNGPENHRHREDDEAQPKAFDVLSISSRARDFPRDACGCANIKHSALDDVFPCALDEYRHRRGCVTISDDLDDAYKGHRELLESHAGPFDGIHGRRKIEQGNVSRCTINPQLTIESFKLIIC